MDTAENTSGNSQGRNDAGNPKTGCLARDFYELARSLGHDTTDREAFKGHGTGEGVRASSPGRKGDA